MSAQEVLDYLEDVLDRYALRPSQKIDTLLQAIEDIEDEDESDSDDDDNGD
ncbi:hypothetical protein ES703_97228 [subsurface metagenome]